MGKWSKSSECASAGWVIFPVLLSVTRMHVYERAQTHIHTHRDASRNYLHAHTVTLACIIKIKDRKLTTICKEAYMTITPENLHK